MNTLNVPTAALPAATSPLQGLLGPCLRGALFVALMTGVAYPLATTGVAQLVLPHQANGSLIERGGAVVGSALIGQWFEGAGYFQPRPSTTQAPDPQDASKSLAAPYNAGASSGSNLGPTNPALIASVQERVAAYRQANGLAPDAAVPVDAVTASASGLDPHVSVANAELQAARVARARGLAAVQVQQLVQQHREGRVLGLLGEPRVNVLRLNLALDALKGGKE
ncbi:K(+)-transporting ATPase subunit C [Comamonas sp. NLF-1-9]|uniref:K(+)-transporting ATPase subunit C n=1 Tax=Comamonas sp. NLF-1-9 TaxID=2853163 RepID=UPI001C43967F|nr:K(+)-transporting ATPase subunit C [Comamonas sp. NLF-1-9]QXL83823.1 K(+)-transporting ATPase subunit C [Comamonas sp. NLF-1-9]